MTRCALCPGVNTCVPPSGAVELGKPLFIGEAPGRDEDRAGMPFVGKTGEEVNRHYLPLAGLRRDQCAFTNAIKCWPTSRGGKINLDQPKDRALLESCAMTHLYSEIEQRQPSVLVLMGAFACAAINPDIDLELDHGIPCETPWGIPAFPMYHPAGGLHEPKKMLLIRNDWIRLKQYLAGKLHRVTDAYPRPDYQLADHVAIDQLVPTQPIGCDTEFDRQRKPYCFTWSQVQGTGRLIMAEDTDLLAYLQKKFDHWRAPILFHSWLADRSVTEDMGLRLPEKRIVDTLAWVFHLGNLPLGLKTLAYRELGMAMQDWEDLVTPHSAKLALAYLGNVYLNGPWPKPEEQLVLDETGHWKLYKPQSLSTKLKRLFSDLKKGPRDLFQTWDNWEMHHDEVRETCGDWPGKDIRHVPFTEMLAYACRDADALLRLYYILKPMRQRVRKVPQERWAASA